MGLAKGWETAKALEESVVDKEKVLAAIRESDQHLNQN